jgi:methionine-rich copper-binding protein CopC
MALILPNRRPLLGACLALALAVGSLFAGPADAHAIVVDSVPAPGAAIAGPTADLTIRFNSRIDSARSELVLKRPDGTAAPLAILPQESDDRLDAKADGLTPGEYSLQWQVLSVDGHITRGTLPFSVSAP